MPFKGYTLIELVLKKYLANVLILLFMAGLIYGLDRSVAHFFREQTLAPVLAILCFGALIFYGSSSLIIAAIPLFALESYLLMKGLSTYPYIRTVSVVLGGLISFWACLQKKRLEAGLKELDLILKNLQAPWILCDRSGNIRRVSIPAAELIKTSLKDLEATSFFAIFSAKVSKGDLIQKFLRAADSRIPVEKLSLAITVVPSRSFDASFIPIQTREGPGILVTLNSV